MTHPTPSELEAAIRRHFNEPLRTERLAVGDVLLRQGQPNARLFRVRHGQVRGKVADADGAEFDVMRAGPGDLVGVQSFFSGDLVSKQTIWAVEPTELGYIERDMPTAPGEPSLERLLMPIVLGELIRRQRAALELADRERQTREQLVQLEQVSALGQLAAGVAHELNNALTVLVRGTSWIAQKMQQHIDQSERVLHRAFDAGLARGRTASAAEVRQRTPMIEKKFRLPYSQARKIAQTGLTDEQLASFADMKDRVGLIVDLWEMGATIQDMRLAADQSEYVIRSMRDLGASRSVDEEPVDVNETIRIALKILRGQLESIEVAVTLGELPALRGSRGKLVQVWTNILKNALEAMTAGGSPARRPQITITSRATADDIVVTIEDTGPGIPAGVLPRIFEPSFTTKKRGLSFGLGLGLSIVQRLVAEHSGDIRAANTETGARFVIRLPQEVLDV